MSARLPAGILVSALLRRVNDAGGIATVLAKGDPQAGAVLAILLDKERIPRGIERGIGAAGKVHMVPAGPQSATENEVTEYWTRRRARDPDLWVIELDIPSAERFAAEILLDD